MFKRYQSNVSFTVDSFRLDFKSVSRFNFTLDLQSTLNLTIEELKFIDDFFCLIMTYVQNEEYEVCIRLSTLVDSP